MFILSKIHGRIDHYSNIKNEKKGRRKILIFEKKGRTFEKKGRRKNLIFEKKGRTFEKKGRTFALI